ncbi:HEAT domain containing protein [Rubidibacter lacunae KORDI 51-2]|uniref:HEAT domain containing protein n=1 Tax=Rubidibacter lacunae KORDI 51-2 TaxID=582515 RepID=U5DJU5_9CHRO|nr:HEAT repeat domain-containing protein [Rubidibacter lacunae]ERN41961.1 HEAT domain containing protein [Rubidibacter lacunae KORDI 51-2]
MQQVEADKLLLSIQQQLNDNTFDRSDRDLIERAIEGMGDPRGMVRLNFAQALERVGRAATPQLLEALRNHDDPVVRRASAKTLTLLADPEAVPVLIDAFLTDEDRVVRSSAVGALAETGEVSAPPLLEILADPAQSETAKGHAAWALAFMGRKIADLLYKAFESDVEEVRIAAIGAIATLVREQKDEKAFQLLCSSLTDDLVNIRIEAAALLGQVEDRRGVPGLVDSLRDSDGGVRKAAAMSLMKLGADETLSELRAVRDRELDESIQRVLALAVRQLEQKQTAE